MNDKAMFADLPNELIVMLGGAFILGWVLSMISGYMGRRLRTSKRDPRDDRIRELAAELRIASSQSSDSRTTAGKLVDELRETSIALERRDSVISEQQSMLEKNSIDLKDSVAKTRELRIELADRAAESVHAEAKIREVETELSVVQASTDMLANGALDYSVKADKDDADECDGRPEWSNKASS